ncbi:MAG: nitrogenase component 1 [Methanomassiliicoccaceae archaeon]|nr:nitrogenase component 1 [Methanomassiliicoccaceae archaeon]
MNTEPDGFIGAVLATEGTSDMRALINGPGGCRSRAQILLKELVRDYMGEEPGCCSSKYFSRQSRLPCTYLNSNDIVMGSSGKIVDGIGSLLSVTGSDIVMIDTLGASIQVTDNEEAVRRSGGEDRVILANKYLSNMSVYEGFDDTMKRIVEHICSKTLSTIPNSVNILGYNISDGGWEYGKEEISRMMRMLGLETVSFIGCSCKKEDVERSCGAELNILIHPEFSIETAKYYYKEFGIPYLIPRLGSPIGYPSLASFAYDVSDKFGVDPGGLLNEIDSERSRVNKILMNSEKAGGSLRGSSCSVTGISSDVLPIIKWMFDHLSVMPGYIKVLGPATLSTENLMKYLRDTDCIDSLEADPSGFYDIAFTDGMSAEQIRKSSSITTCVETRFPFSHGTSFINRSLIGTYGCRYILDEIINGHGLLQCGQPTMADFR